jgi:6-phosphogluconolactonase
MNTLIASALTYCYVGCSSPSNTIASLHVLKCDTSSGAIEIVQSVKGVQGTTYFQIDKSSGSLYSVVSTPDKGAKTSSVVNFPIKKDHTLGKMRYLASLPCEAPCHVEISRPLNQIAFASYTSATVGVLPIDGVGGLKSRVLPDVGMGDNVKRQKKAYAHFAFYTPENDVVGFIDLGCDAVHFFDVKTFEPVPQMSIKADCGDGPRHAVWSKDRKYLYVLNELSSSVTSYSYDDRKFKRVCKVSMLPDSYKGETKAAAIKITDDGKILMASNRGHDSIAFYATDPKGGLVLKNIAKLKGRFPRDFELMPGEKFMIVGHKMSDEIQVYRFDREKCTLSPVGEPVKAHRPLCFKFMEN